MSDSLSNMARSEYASQNYLASQNPLTGSIGTAMKKRVKQEYNLQIKNQRQLQIEVEQHSKKEQALLAQREAKEKVLAQIETELQIEERRQANFKDSIEMQLKSSNVVIKEFQASRTHVDKCSETYKESQRIEKNLANL